MGAKSQQYHFVYLQTDNKQPFYVRIQEKLYSSSSTGYLVIPKLRPGNHIITVGFPKNEWPSQSIPVQITDKDLGYALKNFESKGWGLYNWQTMEVINSNLASQSNNPGNTISPKNDGFSSVLSEVVNTPLEKKAEVPAPKPATVISPEPTIVPTATPAASKQETVSTAFLPKITQISSVSDQVGTTIMYVDKWEGGIDTIQVLIQGTRESVVKPIESPSKEPVIKEATPVANKVNTETSTTPSNNADGKFLDIELPNPNTGQQPAVSNTKVDSAKKPFMINSDCKQVATEEDFFKSRKKMVDQKSEKAMTEAAIKFFKQKCYTVAQVKNLSAIFLTDAGKFEFFETAYPFVLDSHNFGSLENSLTDSYYISRFQSLVRKP